MDLLREEIASQVSETLPGAGPSGRLGAPPPTGSYGEILRLAAPLILANTGFMLMHLMDAIFLAWHSEESIAAAGPASMAGFTVVSLFIGVCGYASTFVAQYMGAQRPTRVGAAVWQAVYFALASAIVVAAFGFLGKPLFAWVGHGPAIQQIEIRYFEVVCWTAILPLLGTALSAFYIGRGDNTTLMLVQVAGFILNGFLSYGFIFGRFGCPAWGAPGAAVATAGAQGIVFAALAMIFLRPAHRERHWTWRARFFERDLFGRLIRFGLPEGLRFVVEMVAFTVFLFIVGRVGETELAATNIVWRLNGFAFFPLIGLARAIAVLVGHAQGLSRPELAARATYRGVLISEAWMLFTAAVFLLAPRQLMAIFNNDAGVAPQETEQIVALGVVLLRFVALYCVLDGLNVIFLGALQGAGDTRWTFAAACGIYTIFLGMLVAMDHYHASLYQLWGVMTFFVMAQALIWFARFRVGRWRTMRVIEPSVAENSDGNT